MTQLVYVNPNKEDNCELNPNWKVLSKYMGSHYIKSNSYEVHHKYFIAIEDIDDDTIKILDKCNITIYSIDYIVGIIIISFENEASRDMVFHILKGEVA